MTENISKEIHLKNRPEGLPTESDFELARVAIPEIGEGQVLVQNIYMSVDPYMRGRMYDRKSYFLSMPKPGATTRSAGGRPLGEIARQPAYLVAVASAMVGYGVMNFIMIATPLAMHDFAHPFSDTAFVIQWHVFGMFVPSFFTGHLIRKFGTANIMLAGVLLLGLCVGINFTGTTVIHFWSSLIFLGLGWNFLFVGATTQLTETYSPGEKAKAQALNDFIVFGTVTLTSLSSGAVQNILGWETINMAVIPFLLLIVLANLWLRGKPLVLAAEPVKK